MSCAKHLLLIVLPARECSRKIVPPPFSTDVHLVNLFATVRDSQGHVVNSLNRDDFILKEDGRPQIIRYFSQKSGLPITLGLLVDISLSQRRVLPEERSASYRCSVRTRTVPSSFTLIV
jgi:VWFA-related protein